VPSLAALRAMPAASIRAALESGKMREQAAALSAAERDRVAAFLGTAGGGQAAVVACSAGVARSTGSGWNGWGPDLANSRMQPDPGWPVGAAARLKLKWAFALGAGNMARSQPAVVDGRVYVGSVSGMVYSLDAATGCAHWSFRAAAPIRSGFVTAGGRLYFGDGKGNVYALDNSAGKEIWRVRADDHPHALVTGTVQIHEGVLYVPVASFEEGVGGQPKYECCTFRGSLLALDTATGRQLWKTFTIADPSRPTRKNSLGTQLYGPSGAGVWSAPTIDAKTDRIYIATGDNYSDPPTTTSDAILALDRKTGRVVWGRQFTANDAFNLGCSGAGTENCPEAKGPDHDLGQPPILVNLSGGKRALVVGQKSGVVHAVDPDKEGEILWQTRVGIGGTLGGIQWGSAADGQKIYVALSDLAFARAGGRTALDSRKGGGIIALQLTTGEKLWTARTEACPENRTGCSPANSAAVSATPDVIFAGSLDGHIRGYSARTGDVVWDFDTAREFVTVNGTKANGGSIDGPGPAIAGGMLFTNSGYGAWGGMPGNVLLAFSVDEK